MRTFGVSIENDAVWCDTEHVRVKKGYRKEFDVRLDNKFAKDYKLKVALSGNGDPAEECLRMDRQSTDHIRLIDDNSVSGRVKFDIALEPFPKSGAPSVKPLDPIIDND